MCIRDRNGTYAVVDSEFMRLLEAQTRNSDQSAVIRKHTERDVVRMYASVRADASSQAPISVLQRFGAPLRDRIEIGGLKAVSYTHLDVYKRQDRSCAPACSTA